MDMLSRRWVRGCSNMYCIDCNSFPLHGSFHLFDLSNEQLSGPRHHRSALFSRVASFFGKVSVCVSNCADATHCSSFHPVGPSSCHRKPGQKLIHVRFQGNYSPSFFEISGCMLVDSWQSAWWEAKINCPQLKTKLMWL